MEKESLDQNRSVYLVLYSTQRQSVYCTEAFPPSRLPGEGAASVLPVFYVRAPTSRVLNPNPMCTRYGRSARVRVRNTCGAQQVLKIRVRDCYAHCTQAQRGTGALPSLPVYSEMGLQLRPVQMSWTCPGRAGHTSM